MSLFDLFKRKKVVEVEEPKVAVQPQAEEINLDKINTTDLIKELESNNKKSFRAQCSQMIQKVEQAEKEFKKNVTSLALELQESYTKLVWMKSDNALSNNLRDKIKCFLEKEKAEYDNFLRIRISHFYNDYFDEFYIRSSEELPGSSTYYSFYPALRFKKNRDCPNEIKVEYYFSHLYDEEGRILLSGPWYIKTMRQIAERDLPEMKRRLTLFLRELQ